MKYISSMNAISESCMRVTFSFFKVRLYQIAITPSQIKFIDSFFCADCQMYFELTKSQKENENKITIEANFEHAHECYASIAVEVYVHGLMFNVYIFFPAVI